MQVETLEIQWKTFSEELPIRDVWIYVTPPDCGYLGANETTLMANANNGDEHINDGYHFYHLRSIRYLKNSMNWKWCYPGDIKQKKD